MSMTTTAPAAQLELQLKTKQNLMGDVQRVMSKGRRIMRDLLAKHHCLGTWEIQPITQIGGKDMRKFYVSGVDETRKGLTVIIKPGDNGSRWSYLLSPPEGTNLEELRMTLTSGLHADSRDAMHVERQPQPALPATPIGTEADKEREEVEEVARLLGLPKPIAVGMGLYCVAAEITPDMALDWLAEHNIGNRTPAKTTVARYGADLASGHWVLTHQGVGFVLKPELRMIDGSNRLNAVLEEKRSMPLLVTLNLPPEAVMGIDQTRVRTLRNLAQMTDTTLGTGAAFVKFAIGGYGVSQTNYSHQQVLTFVDKYRLAYQWTIEKFQGLPTLRGVTVAPVQAAIFRAYHHVPHDRLSAFVDVLITAKYAEEWEYGAVNLQQQLLQRKGSSSGVYRTSVYGKTTRAIHAYVNQEKLTVVRSDTTERYQLPADPEDWLKRKGLISL